MRKFAFTGLIVSAIYVATVAGVEVTPQSGPPKTVRMVGDPIAIGDCRLGVINKVDLAGKRNGQLEWLAIAEVEKLNGGYRYVEGPNRDKPVPANRQVATVQIEVLEGQQAPEGVKVLEGKGVLRKRRYYERYYLQLMEGDIVEVNQTIGQVDDRLAHAELMSKSAKSAASKADVRASEKTRDEAKFRWNGAKKLYPGSMSLEDYRAAEVTFERYESEYFSKGEMVKVAQEELNQARVVCDLHEIRSTLRGTVKVIYKNPGEAVRELEPVVQIQNLDRLKIEGLIDAQYRHRVRPGMKVFIESPRRVSPQLLKGHLQEVTCVAVTNHPEKPLIVSGSEDGTIRVWDRTAEIPELRSFPEKPGVGFRSVACSPRGNYILAGSSDGVVWLFDLDKGGKEPVRKMEGGHRLAVTMVAFNSDGTLCVTAGEDRPRGSICVWETATGKKRAVLPAIHGGAITSVQFTAGGHIVSAARDNTVRVWSLGSDDNYQNVLTLPKRSGDVPTLGVSPDGKHVLFDQGKELRVLTLPEGRYYGSLANPTSTSPFTTMALFSPNGKLILTAGSSEGRMQLWGAPATGRRGQELVHLIPPERSQVTSGAFAPNGKFLVSGSKDRLIQVWDVPEQAELDEQIVAEVMHVDPSIESGGRQIRIRADVDNRNGRLLLNDTVTMVIYPQ